MMWWITFYLPLFGFVSCVSCSLSRFLLQLLASMNIFILDNSPIVAARYLGDDHLNKMILESCQMFANCFTKEQLAGAPFTQKGKPWRRSHYNHPCSKWVRQSTRNSIWMILYVKELFNERKYRFPKREEHDCRKFFEWVMIAIGHIEFPEQAQTPFAVAIPDGALCRRMLYFNDMDAVRQYRGYYAKDKVKMHHWTKRDKPSFIP